METTQIMSDAVRKAVNSLFFIMKETNNEILNEECQSMINVLYREFPGVMPQPVLKQ